MNAQDPGFGGPFPPATEILPHGPAAVFIERVLERTEADIVCEVVPGTQDGDYAEDGVIPAELGIEYMAQAVAAYAGLSASVERRREVGYIIAVRSLQIRTPGFALGQPLIVRATREWGESHLARFAATIERDGELLVSAFLSVFRPTPSRP